MDSSLPFSLPNDSELTTTFADETTSQPEEYAFEDDEAVAKTPDEVLYEMKVAWVNENCAPTLLPHKYDAAECLLDQVDSMESNIDACRNKSSLKVATHKMEVLRIGYLVNDYLRVRLEKIERNSRGLLKAHNQRANEGKAPLLAEEELQFIAKFATAEAKLLGSCLYGKLPTPFRRIPVVDIKTDYERVFARTVAENVENVTVPDYQDKISDSIVEMEKDSVHLISFNAVRDHVESGKVQLM